MITEFKLTEKEAELARKFKEKHKHPNINKGAIGGHITYHFTPTSVANGVKIECNICDTVENITDYDDW